MVIRLIRAVNTFLRIIVAYIVALVGCVIVAIPFAFIGAQMGYKDEDIDNIDVEDIIEEIMDGFVD